MRRTNIELDEKLVGEGKKLTGLKTSKELVNYALSQLIRRERQKRLLSLEGNVGWSGDLAVMRSMRGPG